MQKAILLTCLFLLLSCKLMAQSISISAPSTNICRGDYVQCLATPIGPSHPHFQWLLNNTYVGTDTVFYTTSAISNGDTIKCRLMNNRRDSILAVSNSIVISVQTTRPIAGTISGSNKVCPGDSTILTSSVTGGDWHVSNSHASVKNGLVKGVSADCFECCLKAFDTIYYSVSNACGTDSAQHIMQIDPLPSPSFDINSTFSCPHMDIHINEPYCYDALFFVPTDTGINFVRGYLRASSTTGCGTDTFEYYGKVTYYSNIEDPPLLSVADSAICVGKTTLISSPDSTWGHYFSLDNDNGKLVDSAGQLFFKALNAGVCTVTLQYSDICSASPKRATRAITINPIPHALPSLPIICPGQTISLSDSTPGGTWTSENKTAIVTADGRLTGKDTGSALLTYTSAAGCAITGSVSVGDCDHGIKIYPNPFHNELNLEMSISGLYDKLVVNNVLGQMLLTQTITSLYMSIDTSPLPVGQYFIHIYGWRSNSVYKMVKE